MGRAHTFIIYCGNVLNAWLNTGIQIHPGEDKGGKWVRLTRRKSHIKTQNGHLLRVFPLINVHLYYFTNTHTHTGCASQNLVTVDEMVRQVHKCTAVHNGGGFMKCWPS